MITMEPRDPCKLCGGDPVFYPDGSYDWFGSSAPLEGGFMTEIRGGPDESGRFYMMAVGEDTSDRYYPKFCPECGRFLGAEHGY